MSVGLSKHFHFWSPNGWSHRDGRIFVRCAGTAERRWYHLRTRAISQTLANISSQGCSVVSFDVVKLSIPVTIYPAPAVHAVSTADILGDSETLLVSCAVVDACSWSHRRRHEWMDGVKPLLPWQHLALRTSWADDPAWTSAVSHPLFLESTHPSCDGSVLATFLFRYLGYGVTIFMKGNDFSLLEETAVAWHVLAVNLKNAFSSISNLFRMIKIVCLYTYGPRAYSFDHPEIFYRIRDKGLDLSLICSNHFPCTISWFSQAIRNSLVFFSL